MVKHFRMIQQERPLPSLPVSPEDHHWVELHISKMWEEILKTNVSIDVDCIKLHFKRNPGTISQLPQGKIKVLHCLSKRCRIKCYLLEVLAGGDR